MGTLSTFTVRNKKGGISGVWNFQEVEALQHHRLLRFLNKRSSQSPGLGHEHIRLFVFFWEAAVFHKGYSSHYRYLRYLRNKCLPKKCVQIFKGKSVPPYWWQSTLEVHYANFYLRKLPQSHQGLKFHNFFALHKWLTVKMNFLNSFFSMLVIL